MENEKEESHPEDGGIVPDRLGHSLDQPLRGVDDADRSRIGEWSVPTGARSLRDDFAMLALKTILADDASLAIGTPDEIDELAVNCYAVADAMMKARG